ncbi:glutamate carboxypeptidase, partial [Flavobacteriaceae bacterium]|nr:glutamate carboxypeptidase [Flavobacteriaceae bacterium]
KVAKAIETLQKTSEKLTLEIEMFLNQKALPKKKISNLNQQLIGLEKSFISEKGMYFGSWYKSLYASSDPFSGYAAWILPGLEYEIALKSSERLEEWEQRYVNAIRSLNDKMLRMNATVTGEF